jgi:hypothetical protein
MICPSENERNQLLQRSYFRQPEPWLPQNELAIPGANPTDRADPMSATKRPPEPIQDPFSVLRGVHPFDLERQGETEAGANRKA